MGRISSWHARHHRAHKLTLDRAIRLANTGNILNFLVRIRCGWAGQSLPFKSSHLCVFTIWLTDKFKNKTKTSFPPRKTQPLKWWVTNSKKESAVFCCSNFLFFKEGFMFTVEGCVSTYGWVLRGSVKELEKSKARKMEEGS